MNAWKYHPARDLELHGLERHRCLHRENGLAASILRFWWWWALRTFLRGWHGLHVTGRGNLPVSRPFILISNHTSHLDAPILASLLPIAWRDDVYPVAASDTFFEKRSTAAFADWFLNALAIRRRCARSHDLDEMRTKLTHEGSVLIIFPEGTRSRTGALQSFHSGIGRLVAQSDIPVIPCHLDGCFEAFPPGQRFIRPARITVTIGPPIRFADCPDKRAGWDTISEQLRTAVENLATGKALADRRMPISEKDAPVRSVLFVKTISTSLSWLRLRRPQGRWWPLRGPGRPTR